jgi:hypothetical protein
MVCCLFVGGDELCGLLLGQADRRRLAGGWRLMVAAARARSSVLPVSEVGKPGS